MVVKLVKKFKRLFCQRGVHWSKALGLCYLYDCTLWRTVLQCHHSSLITDCKGVAVAQLVTDGAGGRPPRGWVPTPGRVDGGLMYWQWVLLYRHRQPQWRHPAVLVATVYED